MGNVRRRRQPFKNALCLAAPPEGVPGFSYPPYAYRCKRHSDHKGEHRIVFHDGGVREWATGDKQTLLTKEPRDA